VYLYLTCACSTLVQQDDCSCRQWEKCVGFDHIIQHPDYVRWMQATLLKKVCCVGPGGCGTWCGIHVLFFFSFFFFFRWWGGAQGAAMRLKTLSQARDAGKQVARKPKGAIIRTELSISGCVAPARKTSPCRCACATTCLRVSLTVCGLRRMLVVYDSAPCFVQAKCMRTPPSSRTTVRGVSGPNKLVLKRP
jgi:hypothetical protein